MTDQTSTKPARRPVLTKRIARVTPKQELRLMSGMASMYERECHQLRSTATYCEKQAASLRESIAAGRPINDDQMQRALWSDAYVVRYRANRLLGLAGNATHDDALAVLYPRMFSKDSPAKDNPPAAPPSAQRATPSTQPASTMDALSQATAIARSVSCDEIDWTREPLTERERRVRVRYLDKLEDHAILELTYRVKWGRHKKPGDPIGNVASDLGTAAADAKHRGDEERDREFLDEHREILADAISDVDRESGQE